MGPGGPPGLQNQPWGVKSIPGEFDSHTLPPDKSRLPGFGSLFVFALDLFCVG